MGRGFGMESLRQEFERLYGNRAERQWERYREARTLYAQVFGDIPRKYYSVPGRSELGGNHTDHQQGCVLTAAVDLDTVALVCPVEEPQASVLSEGYAPFEVDLRDMSPNPAEQGMPAGIVRGVAARMAELGYKTGGFCAYITSDVQSGSGLSSSAAFEVLIATILSDLYNENAIAPAEIAKIARYAENEYFGKPCGLQDQMACALGGVSYIDFKDSPKYEKLAFALGKHGYTLCITHTGGAHVHLTEAYAAIRDEMQFIARCLGQETLRACDPAEFFAALPFLRSACGDRAVLRAYHFFAENERPLQMAEALKADDFAAFLRLVNDSGRSSFEYLQNIFASGEERSQAMGVALMLSERLLCGRGAWRVHGGGFAGTIQAYVPLELGEDYRRTMEAVFGEGCVNMLSFREAGPVCLDAE